MTSGDDHARRLAEAMLFAAATPVTARALAQVLPAEADAEAVLASLTAEYAGRGVELVEVAGGFQFRTAPDLAPLLRKVVEVPRRLPRVAMEVLAIIAYHQPVTRPEIEEIRGASLSQQTLDALLEAALIAPAGRRESPGRPSLWATTPAFLAQFGLKGLRDLPKREDLLVETGGLPAPAAEGMAAAAVSVSKAATAVAGEAPAAGTGAAATAVAGEAPAAGTGAAATAVAGEAPAPAGTTAPA